MIQFSFNEYYQETVAIAAIKDINMWSTAWLDCIHTNDLDHTLGAVHKIRHPGRGREGVGQMLTLDDMGEGGVQKGPKLDYVINEQSVTRPLGWYFYFEGQFQQFQFRQGGKC